MERIDAPRVALDSAELSERYDLASTPQLTHGRDLVALLAIHPGERVLDVGCGTGRLAAIAADAVGPNGRVIGIDPAPTRIDLAQRRGDARLEFRVGHAEDLSAFAGESFEVAYMNSVLNSLSDRPGAMAQVRRVLKQGGRLGIATTVRERPNELRRLTQLALRAAFEENEPDTIGAFAHPPMEHEPERRIAGDEVRSLLRAAEFATRLLELRTYLTHFTGVAQIVEFLRTTTYDQFYGRLTPDELGRFASALERTLAKEIPASRRASGIQLERYVLLAVADNPATPQPGGS
jgi:ubiquinone/menaquinone biosynthesis C-methylase UbiE